VARSFCVISAISAVAGSALAVLISAAVATGGNQCMGVPGEATAETTSSEVPFSSKGTSTRGSRPGGPSVMCGGTWDWQGNLQVGHSYGEGQGETSGYWNIKYTRANCSVHAWLRRRDNSNWEMVYLDCQYGGATVNYPLSIYNASRVYNWGPSLCFVQVVIDRYV
jgi:hypothetical protein